eukprot:TRINITY_DN7056_c0_g4_i1.p1 TRINITY_DN7056_c0_g4~~TRINITY_DN7056_c0_g4_i1.p1  ORF type:complete len:420 (+),score=78.21 TRINITY_DN7056_c0_g4_i1:845-2104(+)
MLPIISKADRKHVLIDHTRNCFVIMAKSSNEANYKLCLVPDEDTHKWEEVYKLKDDTVLEHYDIFKDYIVLYVLTQGVPSLLVYDLNTRLISEVKFTSDIGEIYPAANDIYASNTAQFKFSSPFVHERQYKVNLKTGYWEIVGETELSNKIRREDFVWKHLYPQSADGTRIPLTLIHKADLDAGSERKLLLYTYGAYGLRTPLNYSPANLAALKQNWAVAFSHIRGSNFNGPNWHQAGCYPHKPLTIEDFVYSLKYLYKQTLATPRLTAAYGSSAGGTVVGAGVNTEPDIVGAAVLRSPFVDVLGTLGDREQALNEANHEEWGDPVSCSEALEQIKRYSPVENVRRQEYPPILVSYSIKDRRVPYWGIMRYLCKMRMLSPKTQLVSTIEDGGHFGSANEEDNLSRRVWELAWTDYILSH